MRRAIAAVLALAGAIFVGGAAPAPARADDLNSLIQSANMQLAAHGTGAEVGPVELFTLGVGRPADRTLQNFFRWVPFDARRGADGANLRYLVRQSLGASSNGLSDAQTEPAIDAALATWDRDSCVANVPIVKRADPGGDTDVFDELIGQGDSPAPNFGLFSHRPADIISAGFRARSFFDRLAPSGGDFIIAITITFFFRTDINNDGYLDTFFAETYYNDNFAWSIGGGLPSIDVQSAALHENGHALGLGHFGPPPVAVMNPDYSGIKLTPFGTDHAGMCAVWGAWPIR